jgi:arginase
MSLRPWSVVGVPSSAGARKRGLERAPASLRAAGLIGGLREAGLPVADAGDLRPAEFRPDPDHPRQRNRKAVVAVAEGVAAEVRKVRAAGRLPLVLGGDCTVTLGVVAALVAESPDLGLLYFDGDLDLNTPDTSPSGFFDGMVAAHLLGGGALELASLGRAFPLVPASRFAFFGYDAASGFVDAPERDMLARLHSPHYPLDELREDPQGAAQRALDTLESRAGRLLVHFDLDATDLPAVDCPHPDGLSWDAAGGVLRTLVSSPRCAGLVVTELDPLRDPEGVSSRRVVQSLVEALRP